MALDQDHFGTAWGHSDIITLPLLWLHHGEALKCIILHNFFECSIF